MAKERVDRQHVPTAVLVYTSIRAEEITAGGTDLFLGTFARRAREVDGLYNKILSKHPEYTDLDQYLDGEDTLTLTENADEE